MHEELARRGGGVVAITVDPVATNQALVDELELPFPVLSDADRAVTAQRGLLHPGAGPGGATVPIPTLLLLDEQARVAWYHIARTIPDRADPADVIAAIRSRWP